MLPLRVNATFPVANTVTETGAPSRAGAVESDSTNLLSSRQGGTSPEAAVRPGPPVSRLEFRTQNQSQGAFGDAEAAPEGEGAPTEAGRETTEPGAKTDQTDLTEAERREVEKLKARDREVRAHERAHATAGGSLSGSPSFTFVRGPDGGQYAVGGEVSIDASPVPSNPEATIRKMEQVKRAALAPSNPSSQDRRVASQADAAILAARQEIAQEKREAQTEEAEKRAGRSNSGSEIGQTDPTFDPQARFNRPVGGLGSPLGTGLVGRGNLSLDTGTLTPGELFNLVA